MRLSLTPRYYQKGFTLIEVMAVVVVIGIAAAVVSFSVGDGARPQQIKSAARQLYGSINLVIEESLLTGQVFGLRFDIDSGDDGQVYSYEWMQFNPEPKVRAWQKVEIKEFQKQLLPEGVELIVEVEKQKIIIGSTNKKEDALFEVKKQKDEKKPIYPDIWFLPSGETQNFTISIADEEKPEAKYLIKGNMLGQLTFKRPDEEE